MADGNTTRIGDRLPQTGPVQRVRQVTRGRTRASAEDSQQEGQERGFFLDDPGIRQGARGGLPDWLGRYVNIYV